MSHWLNLWPICHGDRQMARYARHSEHLSCIVRISAVAIALSAVAMYMYSVYRLTSIIRVYIYIDISTLIFTSYAVFCGLFVCWRMQLFAVPVETEVRVYEVGSWNCVATLKDAHHKEVYNIHVRTL